MKNILMIIDFFLQTQSPQEFDLLVLHVDSGRSC